MTDDARHSPARGERLLAALQHLAPQRTLTALAERASRVRMRAWKNFQIGWFTRRYGVDLDEARSSSADDYEHFNAFFTRALRAGARPLCREHGAVVCPADGRINAIGDIDAGTLIQAKGHRYALDALLGGDRRRAAPFDQGRFASVYLAPRDYHRVHMPLDARLREMTYLPGRMFSVNFATARSVDNLFARNERLVCLFETAFGPMAVVLVGAMIVAGLETVWSGAITPPHGKAPRTWRYGDDDVRLAAGAEMGRFNVGSTVIVLLSAGTVRWREDLEAESRVRVGEALGHRLRAATAAARGASAPEG